MVLIVVPDKYNLLYREVPTMQHFLRRVVVYSSLSSVTKLKAKSRKKSLPSWTLKKEMENAKVPEN